MLGELRLDALALHIGRPTGLCEGSLHTLLQFIDRGSHRAHLRSLFTGSLQQAVAVLHSLVVTIDERGGGSIRDTHIRRNDLVLILGIADEIAHVVDNLHLGIGLGETRGELV